LLKSSGEFFYIQLPVINNNVLTEDEEDGKMIMNSELVWIWKKALISSFEVLPQRFGGVTEEDYKISQDLW
jgi:hypothetical protein